MSKKFFLGELRQDRASQIIFAIYTTVEFVLLFDYNLGNSSLRVSILVLIIYTFIGYLYISKVTHTQIELEKKNLEIKLDHLYGDTYNELLSTVIRRQHDFKNQIGAIYSMHITATSLDELIARQREYGDALLDDCSYDDILTNCKNRTLAGFLYYRCIQCHNKGVRVIHKISVQNASVPFKIYELIELLGILIDNAYENFMHTQFPDPAIELELVEDENRLSILVANPCRYMKSAEIESMFIKGNSTKGEGRGIGLARIRELLQVHSTDIIVENVMKDKCNWLSFQVYIYKK